MANIRDINRKMNSLQNMQKVMRAMKMIASTKFSKLLTKQASLTKFENYLSPIKNSIFKMIAQSTHPFIVSNPKVRKSHIIIFTADRGLCGSHNSSVLKSTIELIKKLKNDSRNFDITSIGSKGAKFCRKKELELFHSIDINEKSLTDDDIYRITKTVISRYKKEEISELYIIYNRFISVLTQPTITEKILPISLSENRDSNTAMTSDLTTDELVDSAVPLLLFYQIKAALSNSYISENGARMTAMENASNNSQNLIDNYVSIKNRVRQTKITNELSEIVSGKEAMNS